MNNLTLRLMNASPSAQRLIALAIALFMLFSIVTMLFLFVGNLYARYEQLSEDRQKLGRLIAIAAAGDRSPANVDGIVEKANGVFLSAKNQSVAAASLQGWLQELATSRDITINSISSVEGKQKDELATISLRANVSGRMRDIHGLISDREKDMPKVLIKEILLNSNVQVSDFSEEREIEINATIMFFSSYAQST